MGKSHSKANRDTDLFDYMVVIDAGSKGSRAHLYKSLRIETNGSNPKRDWKAELETTTNSVNYPQIELVKSKKVKPGIATFVDNPKKLNDHYMGKLLKTMEEHIPKNQRSRTPVFLHATGGVRLLKPEEQSKILTHICKYIKDEFELFLPDCDTHINTISGETEGLYSWLGLNYRYGVLDPESKENGSYGMLDMGGVSSQVAFEPSNSHNNTDILFKLNLDYTGNAQKSLQYQVFSQSLLSGMHQAHLKYDERLLSNSISVDPCLPTGYIKTVVSKDGLKSDVEGGGDFEKCLTTLYDVLLESSVDKYCDPDDKAKGSSCLLSDELPKMDFNYHKFIGINEIYSNLKKHVNYKEFYEATKKICDSSYTDLLANVEVDKTDVEKYSELCFKSSWIIDVLHQGVNFPRYGIDNIDQQSAGGRDSSIDENFRILDEYSWTLGRAVLYSYYEAAQALQGIETPEIGYYPPSSKVFVYGGEAPGVATRPSLVSFVGSSEDKHDDDNDSDDEDSDDDGKSDDWDDVLEEHRLWGSLLFLLILLVIAYLLMGRTKRQSIKDTIKRIFSERFRSNVYTPVNITNDDLELGDVDALANEASGNKSSNHDSNNNDDDFNISE